MCVVADGLVLIVHLTWEDTRHGGKEISLRDVLIYEDLEADALPAGHLSVKLKRLKSVTSLGASSANIFDIGRYLIVGTSRGVVVKLGWDGQVLSSITISHEHALFRTWTAASVFDLVSESLASGGSNITSSVSSEDVSLPLVSVSGVPATLVASYSAKTICATALHFTV